MRDSASFWTDIRDLEEQLDKVPESLCFSRLAEVYLQVGLVGDALHVARLGVLKHPRFLSGQRVLSQACHASGLNDEAMAALQLVTEALPEDIVSQKLLGRLLAESGNKGAASLAFRIALEFAPDDVECRIEFESLERSAGVTETSYAADDVEDDEAVIEGLEIFEEIEILDEYQPEPELCFKTPHSGVSVSTSHDPLTTSTLAELYVSQGFIRKALEIYRMILAGNPEDRSIAARIDELEKLEDPSPEDAEEIDDTFEDEAEIEIEPLEFEFSMASPEPENIPVACGMLDGNLPGETDRVISVLDGWLDNVSRIKSCR